MWTGRFQVFPVKALKEYGALTAAFMFSLGARWRCIDSCAALRPEKKLPGVVRGMEW
jgi:hypothetical protein